MLSAPNRKMLGAMVPRFAPLPLAKNPAGERLKDKRHKNAKVCW